MELVWLWKEDSLFHQMRTKHHTEYEEYEKLQGSAIHNMSKLANVPAQNDTWQTLAESFYKKVPYDKKNQRWQNIVLSEITSQNTIQATERDEFQTTFEYPRHTLPGWKHYSPTIFLNCMVNSAKLWPINCRRFHNLPILFTYGYQQNSRNNFLSISNTRNMKCIFYYIYSILLMNYKLQQAICIGHDTY